MVNLTSGFRHAAHRSNDMQPIPAPLTRRRTFAYIGAYASMLSIGSSARASDPDYPDRSVELIVPYAAGGGTDAVARSFADVSRKYFRKSIIAVNKPGASTSIGTMEVINARADGYKIALVTVELTFLNSLGIARFTHDRLVPIARLNYDPSAITVRADSPWKTIEEFLAAAKKSPGEMRVGNAGPGSIWNLTASALEDKAQVRFNQVPYQGAAPAVLALMGGHIDAVAVSPAEVGTYVAAGKLRLLAVMAEKRIPAFAEVPTFRERGVDLVLGVWRGLAAPKDTPPKVLQTLRDMAAKTAQDPAFLATLQKLNLGYAYADDRVFGAQWSSDSTYFKSLIAKLNMKLG